MCCKHRFFSSDANMGTCDRVFTKKVEPIYNTIDFEIGTGVSTEMNASKLPTAFMLRSISDFNIRSKIFPSMPHEKLETCHVSCKLLRDCPPTSTPLESNTHLNPD